MLNIFGHQNFTPITRSVQDTVTPKYMQSIIKTEIEQQSRMTYKALSPTNSFVFDIKHENQHMSLVFNTKTRERR